MNDQMTALAARAEARCRSRFDEIDRVALLGTEKVLAAFAEERVQTGDFAGTTGYGYDDVGRDKLERIYARVLGGEAALVRTAFVNGKVDEVKLCYNHARNAADQDLREEVVLPIQADAFSTSAPEESSEVKASPDFEPSAEGVLDSLLPAYVETMIYHALIDSAAAEQGARRKAMKSATDNATTMIASLDLLYNRIRQSAITTEITEIVGGAAALED